MSDIPPVPPGTGAAGKRLWRGVLETYELAAHEMELLREAVATADLLARIESELRDAPLLITDKRGETKTNPLAVEARMQRQRYASLIASLRLPDTDDGRTQHRGGARGSYGKRGRETGRAYGSLNAIAGGAA